MALPAEDATIGKNSSIIRHRVQPRTLSAIQSTHNNSASHCPPQPYPPMIDAGDYEVQLHVNFETCEFRLLKIVGAAEGAEVFLFTRDRCRPDCADPACRNCSSRKLYQDRAEDPQGTVPFTPNQEYLYCLRFDKRPIVALLALTPREQDVDVQEKGVLAYWLMRWLERAKIGDPVGAVGAIRQAQMAGLAAGADSAVEAPAEPPEPPPAAEIETEPDETTTSPEGPPATGMVAADQPREEEPQQQQQPGTTSEDCLHKQTNAYLPNMQVVYQVKKDQINIILPKPEQLTRPIDVILVTNEEGHGKQQAITLLPGATQSSNNLVALRNTAYTLRVQLHGKGRSVDLLDFITEQKILRVQESKDAPKQLNFLMERLIEQRGTFVLHVTFDEKIVEVGTKPIGEFYLDVDVDAHRMLIGTVQSHASKVYRVERVNKESNPNVLLADKQLVFEGGVDPSTLTFRESIPIERMADYLITVVDPDTKQSLPTSILAFQKNALYVKEIKNSDVRLHVTVQRQPSMMSQSSNANNRRCNAPLLAINRQNPGEPFHCPFRNGWSCFRIHHSTSGDQPPDKPHISQQPPSSKHSHNTTESLATASPAITSITESLSRRSTEPSSVASSSTSTACYSLDVDMPALKARVLIAGDAGGGGTSRSTSRSSQLFIIYEENAEGKLRSMPCHLGQAFKVRHWCKYTVKCVEGEALCSLLSFCLSDKEVREVHACSPAVQLTKRLGQSAS